MILLGFGIFKSVKEKVVEVESLTVGVCCANKTLAKNNMRISKPWRLLETILEVVYFNLLIGFLGLL